ncbi:MAG: hypothetical protein IJZ73_01085 [Clostridia bacterium]|nr:hypothetical protein [Clostridia bacterium]
MSITQLIEYIIDLYTFYLDELNALPRNDFILGEMTAYVETLEIIQQSLGRKHKKLDYVIEQKYKI